MASDIEHQSISCAGKSVITVTFNTENLFNTVRPR